MTLSLRVDNTFVLRGHSNPVRSVAFSPSGKLLASGSWDSTIRLWSVETGALIATLRGHSDIVTTIAFSSDGIMLASGSCDDTIKLWDVGSRAEVATLRGHASRVWSVKFSPDGARLVSGSRDNTNRLWDVESGATISILRGHLVEVRSVAFSPDGTTIASGSHDSNIHLWDATSGRSFAILDAHTNAVIEVQFSPSGEHLASASTDNTARLWNLATRSLIATFKGHTDLVHSVTFSPDGKYLGSGSYDMTIRLWDIETRSHCSTINEHSQVNSISFSPDGTCLASGSDENTVRLWRISSEGETDLQDATPTSNPVGLSQSMTDGEQDTIPIPAQLNNDITGLVSLQRTKSIASGGFGELFLGAHTDRGKVALKKPSRLLDEALIRRFLREVNLWCSVSHQYILPCLGMCRIGLDVYVVSPFIENGDLFSCMARGMDLDRSKLLFEVAEALTHLHHRGIVHGDVKAQNILLGDDGSALLCDFGLAKAFDTMATSTEAKGAGSVRWMAPELFLGESRSMASDVYSLGITIAEVLSGRTPYQEMSEALAVMFHVVYHDGRPPKTPLSSSEGKSYAVLWETAEKCWVKDIKARPHMAQVLGMLFPLTREA